MNPYVIGIDLGGSNITAALVTQTGKILEQVKVPTGADQGRSAVLKRLLNLPALLLHAAQVPASRLRAIGIGAPGLIDVTKGVVRFSPNLPGWTNVSLHRIFSARFPRLPVVIDNDANVAAYGEKWLGAGKGRRDVIMYTLGTGVGGGIILDGRIFHGHCDGAGELGHMTLEPSGPVCGCGNRGCLEALFSGIAITRLAREALAAGTPSRLREQCQNDPRELTVEMVFAAAGLGDALSQSVLDKTLPYLGIAIANTINLFNPELIILGGGISKAGRAVLDPVKAEVSRRAIKPSLDCVRIVLARLGDRAGVLGAAGIALNALPGISLNPEIRRPRR